MRHALLIALLLGGYGCGSDKPSEDERDGDGAGGAALERPETLPRPPSRGLPPELRPPR